MPVKAVSAKLAGTLFNTDQIVIQNKLKGTVKEQPDKNTFYLQEVEMVCLCSAAEGEWDSDFELNSTNYKAR